MIRFMGSETSPNALGPRCGDSSWSPSNAVSSENLRRMKRLPPPLASPPSAQTPALNLNCRGDEPMALQEAPQEDTQGLA